MSSSPAAAPAVRFIIYLGMDVHKESFTIAVFPADAKVPTRLDRLPNDLTKLTKWMARVARDGEIRACYEHKGLSGFAWIAPHFLDPLSRLHRMQGNDRVMRRML